MTLRALLLLSAGFLAITACGKKDEGAEATLSPEVMAAAKADGVKLYRFDCGTIEVADLDIFSTAGDHAGQSDSFVDSCYLIRHPKGDLLWDLGLPAGLIESGPQVNGVFTVDLDRTLTDQLAELELKPADIDYLSISHSHFDHSGQAEQFPGVTWLVHEDEYDAMFGEGADSAPFQAFKAMTAQKFDSDLDVFCDGTVAIIELPERAPCC